MNDILSYLCPGTGISPKFEAGNLSNRFYLFSVPLRVCWIYLFTFIDLL